MASRLFVDEKQLRAAGFDPRMIATFRKLALFADALERLTATEGQVINLDQATDALNELIEDANLTLEALDARLDEQENGNGPYVKKQGDTMSGDLTVNGLVQCDSLRVDGSASAETPAATHTLAININGTTYKVLLAS